MNFKSKVEAYLYSIYVLNEMLKSNIDSTDRINEAVEAIQIHIENHEQDPSVVVEVLSSINDVVTAKDQLVLNKVSRAVRNSDYSQTSQEKWENPLGRRFESQLQIELLTHPTDAMMESVGKISCKIVDILNTDFALQLGLMLNLSEEAHVIAFGGFSYIPLFSEIRDMLVNNEPENLVEIMHVYFKFAQGFVRQLKRNFKSIARGVKEVSDTKMYGSEYYSERGRGGGILLNFTHQMGLLTTEDEICNQSLPEHPSRWVADCKAQPPNLDSPFTRDLIENDTPYVAGPSGMTSMFVGQMLGFDVHDSREEQQHYIAAVSAYMVSGGFHSLHEVLGPIAICLPDEELIPGYHVSMPQEGVRSAPPNYHVFYNMMEEIDPQFSDVRKNGWANLDDFFHNEYLAQAEHLKFYDIIRREIKDIVMSGIVSYESRNKGFFSYKLNPDKKRGKIRSHSYKLMLHDAESPLQQLVISYALFGSKDGTTLQKHVAKALGFDRTGEARKFIKGAIQRELHELILNSDVIEEEQDTKYIETIDYIDEQVLRLIITAANNKNLYTSNERNEFDVALSNLEQLESDLKPAEEHNLII